MSTSEDKWISYAKIGHVAGMAARLKADPGLDVNCVDLYQQSALFHACCYGRAEAVKLLLAHPAINSTIGASWCTPLEVATLEGHLNVIEVLIASGKDLGLQPKLAFTTKGRRNRSEVVSLLERFRNDPKKTRLELRVKLRFPDELAAEIFALIVFLCDNLLQLKRAPTDTTTTTTSATALQFFAIASKLPMELQMILCHRAVGSVKQNILHKDSEPAFKSLAKILLFLLPTESK